MKTTGVVRHLIFARQPGLDAAAAVLLAKCATQFDAAITINSGPHSANAKSLMGLLTLAVKSGDTVTVVVEGEDAAEAAEAIQALFRSAFAHYWVNPTGVAARRAPGEIEHHAAHVA